MRPVVKFLSNELIGQILDESRNILRTIGVEINNHGIVSMLSDHGAKVGEDRKRVFLTDDMIDKALSAAPKGFKLFDVLGNQTHDLSGHNVHFTPGSAAIHILDNDSDKIRPPTSLDYVKYAKLVSRLDHLASQSTAMIPSDVHQNISDSYRLYLGLLLCEKPVVTGTFTIDAFHVMRDLQLAVRGTSDALKQKPLTVFSCCPTAPLKWSDVTSQNLVDCAELSIPVEY
ncbi:MAG: trimethylamine methyltransferase family protein, partial [Phycisphaerae bacterium]